MTASSSFIELRISNPPSFHSPLSLVNMDETRTAPCTEEASSLMNLSVDCHPSIRCEYRELYKRRLYSLPQYTDPILPSPHSDSSASRTRTKARLSPLRCRCANLSMTRLITSRLYKLANPCAAAYLNRIQHFQHSGMSQGSELAHRILGQRETRLVCGDIESKNTAVGAIVL